MTKKAPRPKVFRERRRLGDRRQGMPPQPLDHAAANFQLARRQAAKSVGAKAWFNLASAAVCCLWGMAEELIALRRTLREELTESRRTRNRT